MKGKKLQTVSLGFLMQKITYRYNTDSIQYIVLTLFKHYTLYTADVLYIH